MQHLNYVTIYYFANNRGLKMITNYTLKRVALCCIQSFFHEKTLSSFGVKFVPEESR